MAHPTTLDAILPGDQAATIALIGATREAMLHTLRREVLDAPVLATGNALVNYLHAAMAAESREQLRVLFVDGSVRLVHEEVFGQGSISSATIEMRAIFRRALELEATGLILAHNHPSGDPSPSQEDIRATAILAEAARSLDITVHDHVVIARSGWISLRALGYL